MAAKADILLGNCHITRVSYKYEAADGNCDGKASESKGSSREPEVACWVGGSSARQFSLIKRALASGEIVHVRRGVYGLAPKTPCGRSSIRWCWPSGIYGPSYVSLETAISQAWLDSGGRVCDHEHVARAVTRRFATPLGHFSFARVPQKVF